jgi:hypothetical protein
MHGKSACAPVSPNVRHERKIMKSRMIMFHVPQDKELLSALGVVTLRHEHLNHILKMTIKTLLNLTPEEALDATRYEGSRSLRMRINKLAKKKLGEGEALLKLQALLGRAERLTEKRNQLIHGLWAEELDGDPGIYSAPGELLPLPNVDDLTKLAGEIEKLTLDINQSRLEGFLKEALEKNFNNA